jgi:hypothetical protein
MVLLGDKAQMEAHFGPVGDSVCFSDEAQIEAHFGPFGYSANRDLR